MVERIVNRASMAEKCDYMPLWVGEMARHWAAD
jgi:hypothetical protein